MSDYNEPAFPDKHMLHREGKLHPSSGLTKLEWVATMIYANRQMTVEEALLSASALLKACEEQDE